MALIIVAEYLSKSPFPIKKQQQDIMLHNGHII